LEAGKYTDTGFRYRKNVVNTSDNFGYAGESSRFYDVQGLNNDIFNVVQDFETIARVYIRLDTAQIKHERHEYDFFTLLGDVGGCYEILLQIAMFFLGGFFSFNASIELMQELYSKGSVVNT